MYATQCNFIAVMASGFFMFSNFLLFMAEMEDLK